MAMQFYASPEQIMRDRSELARKGIARGRSAVVLSYSGGVLFVAENLSSALHKVSEIYDRIGFAAVGRYNEFENLRRAGVRMADLNGLSYDRRDVTGRALANAFAQTLGAIFTEQSKPFEVEICVAEVGATADDDELYRLTYDGSVNDEPGRMAMGGQAEAITGVLKSNHRADMSLGEAVKVAVQALGSAGGEGGAARTIAADQLEVAVLDRQRIGRTFRRITGAALTALLDGKDAPAASAERDTPTVPTAEAGKPTSSAGSADLEDRPGQADS
ncbi:proteasome subunit alpha [Micromonospora sp. WMMD1120]|uniref:proteasome subunit alpha n=1 Tax=Micromonospora sp. WMMD1120 TaxID=3016106 RepID=UPI0024159BB8|nr:proteasome subunit alpha [Micromonospora sp. WMMD1120]MDG4809997.1 proteasome subunit alpha [Micromonospora sp. WMMD1120]